MIKEAKKTISKKLVEKTIELLLEKFDPLTFLALGILLLLILCELDTAPMDKDELGQDGLNHTLCSNYQVSGDMNGSIISSKKHDNFCNITRFFIFS